MSTTVASSLQSVANPTISSLIQTLTAVIFGVSVVYAVGFLPMEAAHNAAHDTRHSLVFPCH